MLKTGVVETGVVKTRVFKGNFSKISKEKKVAFRYKFLKPKIKALAKVDRIAISEKFLLAIRKNNKISPGVAIPVRQI